MGNKKSAERVNGSIIRFIEERMLLKVNRGKNEIKKCTEVTYIGYSFLSEDTLRLSDKSEQNLKDKFKDITLQNRGVSFEQILKELDRILRGWLAYFRLVRMKILLEKTFSWRIVLSGK
ncbi:group II intron maturase-specific domain-containing protein, partial [Proteiniphilum sp. UBA5375]|uniref:group II intron maturase-specific domain-containing protein n=1 Tax=Proteiniphilum sp. UBA5375 TaxID=1947278 RepID=UPI00257ECF7F